MSIETHAAHITVAPCADADAILDLFDGGDDMIRRSAWAAHVQDAMTSGVTFLVAKADGRDLGAIAYAEREGRLRIYDQLVLDGDDAEHTLEALDSAVAEVATASKLELVPLQAWAIG